MKRVWMLGSVSLGDVVRGMLDMSARWHGAAGMVRATLNIAIVLAAAASVWALSSDREEALAITAVAALSFFGAGRIYRAGK